MCPPLLSWLQTWEKPWSECCEEGPGSNATNTWTLKSCALNLQAYGFCFFLYPCQVFEYKYLATNYKWVTSFTWFGSLAPPRRVRKVGCSTRGFLHLLLKPLKTSKTFSLCCRFTRTRRCIHAPTVIAQTWPAKQTTRLWAICYCVYSSPNFFSKQKVVKRER